MKTKNLVFSIVAFLITLSAQASSSLVFAATLAGKVSLEGTAPESQALSMDADPTCMMAHTEPVTSHEVVVNANNTLKNVFVYVKEGLAGQAFQAPIDPVVFDQKGCLYDPHVFGVRVNQPIEIVNSDPTLHNVHALPTNSAEFNLGMPIQGMKLKKTFTAPEIMVKIKCEVHPWMAAYVGVIDHPFFGVTNDQGAFEIKDLPPGEYILEAWHEKFGVQTQSITVTDQPQEVTFQFKAV